MGFVAEAASLTSGPVLLAAATAASVIVAGVVLWSLRFLWQGNRYLQHWGVSSILLGIGYFQNVGAKLEFLVLSPSSAQTTLVLSFGFLCWGCLELAEKPMRRWGYPVLAVTLVALGAVILLEGMAGQTTFLVAHTLGLLLPAYLLFALGGYYRLCALPFLFHIGLSFVGPALTSMALGEVTLVLANALFLLQSMALVLAASIRRNEITERTQRAYQEAMHGEKLKAENLAVSENQFRQAERIAGLFHWETGQRFSHWHSASENAPHIYGLRPEEFLGEVAEHYMKFIHPDDLAKVKEIYQSLDVKARAYELEYRFVRKDGSTAYIREVGEPIVDKSGTVAKFQGTTQDITPLRQAETELRASRERLEVLARSSGERFWEMDADLRFTWFKDHDDFEPPQQIADIIGKTRWEIAGADPKTDPIWSAHYKTLLARKPFRDFVYEIQDKEGNTVWRSVSGLPTFDRYKRFTGYLGTSLDITQRRQMELERDRALQAAESANRAKSEFLANMSHELRTPLNSIIGFSEIMAREEFGSHANRKYAEYSGDIQTSATHLLSVIDDILDLSRVESDRFQPDESRVAVAGLFESSLSLVRLAASRKGVALHPIIPIGFPHLFIDRRLVKQVLVNLLANAIKFTGEGGTVTIEAKTLEGGGAGITVSDTGIGIPKTKLAKALEPFGQVRNSAQVAHEGTGLGLPLSVKLMEIHGGSLDIDSEEGRGTSVNLTFPPNRIQSLTQVSAEVNA